MNLVEQARDFVEKLFKDKLSSLHNYYNFNLKIPLCFLKQCNILQVLPYISCGG